MAVYTEVSDEELASFITSYGLGELLSFKGIAEGVENTNYIVHTTRGPFILTLYEKRVEAGDLPFYLGLMEHLAEHGVTCPTPVRDPEGRNLRQLSGRPAALVTFLEGFWVRRPTAAHCAAVGRALAQLHLGGEGFALRRANALGLSGWRPLYDRFAHRAGDIAPDLAPLIEGELAYLEANWPANLPQGVIHADLFPDNVFFIGDRLSGLIDFYFACNDAFAYDIAVSLNAWCFEKDMSFNITKGQAFLRGYETVRPITPAERAAMPTLARGSALRFLLTRAYDWLNTPKDALVSPKNPIEYVRRLRFHQGVRSIAEYGLNETGNERAHSRFVIYTDGACSGNPGPGGWGAILIYGDHCKEISGGEADDDQQPHGVDGGDLGAGSLEAAEPRRAAHRQRLREERHHRLDPRLEEERLAHGRQEAGEERRALAAPRRGAAPTRHRLALGEGPRRPR